MPRRRRLPLAACCLAVLVATLGCGGPNRLETGYVYTPLNTSPVEQRAFYADPYSGEAQRAAAEAGQDEETFRQSSRGPRR